MRKIFLLCLVISGCGPTCAMTSQECHNMCYPRQVDRFDEKGCYCSDGKPPQPESKS